MSEQHKAFSTQEEREQLSKRRITSVLSWLLFCVAVAIFIFGSYFAIQNILSWQKIQLEIKGTHSAQEKRLIEKQLLGVEEQRYFFVDLAEVRDRVLKQQWVDEVVVSRAWPSTIQVNVIPRQAVAKFGQSGRWVSDTGEIFDVYNGVNKNSLPSISGSPEQIKKMMLVFEESNRLFKAMDMRLTDLYLSDRMTCFLQFNNGMRIIVDQERTLDKLQQLSLLAKTQFKPVWSKIESFDLRYRDGLSIQWKNAQSVKYSNGRFSTVEIEVKDKDITQEKK